MPKLVIANWKMNPRTVEDAVNLAKKSDAEGLVICPPLPFLKTVKTKLKKAKLGAQDVFWESEGAYTGEVSPPQLKDLGVEYVIIGHSERRQNLGETDEMIAKKIKAAMDNDLIPILCVGETKAQRDSGATKEIIEKQLRSALSLSWGASNAVLVVAYEPIWAIGSGAADTPENTINVVRFIKDILATGVYVENSKIIYGGSLTSENAEKFFAYDEIEGALVGGASLDPKEIKKIIRRAGFELSSD